MINKIHKNALLLLVIFIVPIVYSFYLALIQKPFADDWFMLEIARELYGKPLLDWLTVRDPTGEWRPLVYNMFGLYLGGHAKSLVLFNIVKIFLYLFTGGLVYLTTRLIFGLRSIALIASFFFFCNPSNVGAFQNLDHVFKITGTIFYGISVGFLWLYLERGKGVHFVLAFLTFVVGFYSSADALAIFPAMVFLLLIYSRTIGFKKVLAITLAAICIIVGYFYLRYIITGGAIEGGIKGRQDILLNFNVIINIFISFVSSFIFTMSPYVYLKDNIYLFIGSFFLIINSGIMCVAFIMSSPEMRKRIIVLMGLAFIAMIPFVLIRHLSEIYTIRSTYFFMIVFGYSVWLIYNNSKMLFKIVLSMYIITLLISGIFSFLSKQEMMLSRGINAEDMAISIRTILPSPPHYSTIKLDIGDCGIRDVYSDFINTDKMNFIGEEYCVRYIYQDATLNKEEYSRGTSFCLKWVCEKRSFILIKDIYKTE